MADVSELNQIKIYPGGNSMDKDWMAEQKRVFYKLDDIMELLEEHRAERIKVRYQNETVRSDKCEKVGDIPQREPVHQKGRLSCGRVSE